jgi:cell division protein FtsW (lipid II flippase)
MPPVECLSMLSDLYHISINEILAGKRVRGEGFAQIADQNLTATLQDLEKEHRVFEKRMMWVLAIATLLAMLIMILLPMESWKDIVVLVLVWALALIANTVIIVALAAKNPKKDTDVDEDE